ncbi:protein kinase [Aggregicoccus sp. 17bor-14]|uniref:serine/threonine-protein kinase n=1 Tax=Myxococcaceae TaxID=31 RepID=UPI00129D2202|nr:MULTISPECIES: serine/threonine-protein kinase [Myxococcaceae]MBF5045506.1 protein kinase [Simulacricoccus sp. 17bor-14]MRI91243.1 protein kinase [Aggregicoccus sp. 17bor-14]
MKKPTFLGKYLLLERINVGGMAEIFIAKEFGIEGVERILAIKKILPTMAEDQEFITMFIDEARISLQLNHANIVHIHELGKYEDNYFIAMEYVSGRDVRTLIERFRKRRTTMPTAQAVFVASKICEGLDYAHRRKDSRGRDLQIIHRDVSPQNMLISYEGEVKIIDFGIAKAANRSQKTQAGILKGKFGYMSPEQVRGQPIDRRSDVFAVGVILFEMLTGEKLFVGESDFSTLEKVRNAEVPLPTRLNPQIPADLERVLLKALARDPNERYQWASELQEDLLRFLRTGDSVYSSKTLAGFMKESFADDLQREADRMERYSSITGPDDVQRSVSAAQTEREATPSKRQSLPEPASGELGVPDTSSEAGDSSADKTQIFDPTASEAVPEPSPDASPGPVSVFVENQDADLGAASGTSEPRVAESAPGGGEAGESAELAEAVGRPRQQVVLGAPGASAPAETVIGRAPSRRSPDAGATRRRARSEEPAAPATEAAPVAEATAEVDASATQNPVPAADAAAPTARPEPAPRSPPRRTPAFSLRSLSRKQVALGVGAVLLVVAAALPLFVGGRETGDVLVLVRPATGAQVQIDGRTVTPNAVAQLPLGRHRVVASAPGFERLERELLVADAATPPVLELNLVPTPQVQPPETPAATVAERAAPAAPRAEAATGGKPAAAASTADRAPAAAVHPAGPSTAKPVLSAPSTFVAIFVGEPGAEVQVDGKPVGKTPEARLANLAVGRRYAFTVTRAGFKPFHGQFQSEGAPQVKVAFALERELPTEAKRPAAAEPRPVVAAARAPVTAKGRFACSTQPAGAQVWVDGRNTGRQTPVALGNPLMLPVGAHRVVFKLNGKQSQPAQVTITADEVAKLVNVPMD